MTVRLAVAGTPVMPSADAVRILDGDLADVSEQQRLAIAFADVLMSQPGQLSDELVGKLRSHFTDGQLAELTVKILKFNMQKVTVACGHDMSMTQEAIMQQGWGSDGSFVAAK
jgi:alkylhydroperoxidase family enzyme